MIINDYIDRLEKEDGKEMVYINTFIPLTSTTDCFSILGKYDNIKLLEKEENRNIIVADNLEDECRIEESFLFIDLTDKTVVYKFMDKEDIIIISEEKEEV